MKRLSYELMWIDSEFQCGRSEDEILKKRYEEAKKETDTTYALLTGSRGIKEI